MLSRNILAGVFMLAEALAEHTVNPVENMLVARDGPGSVVTSPTGLQWYNSDLSCGAPGHKNATAYTCYSGPAANFPPMSEWVSFNDMWKVQSKYAFMVNGDSKLEKNAVHDAIVKISRKSKVDARVILAVVIHESFGDVRVPCTTSYGGVHNCGLMQSYNATDQAYNASQPRKSITQMIIDGTQGTPSGPGLVQLFNDANDTREETGGNVYAVFRAYNSGSVNSSDLSDGEGALPSYTSDAANYLLGWNGYGDGPSSCGFSSSSPSPTPSPSCTSGGYVPAPTQTVTGTTSDCCKYHTVQSGDTCYAIEQEFGISAAQFLTWNTYLDSQCDNLWLGYAYCVSSDDPVPTGTPTSSSSSSTTTSSSTSSSTSSVTPSCVSSNYVPPPEETRTGSTSQCCTWYDVVGGDSCYSIDTSFSITFAQLQSYNTYLDSQCSNLWAGYAVCVDSDIPVTPSRVKRSMVTAAALRPVI